MIVMLRGSRPVSTSWSTVVCWSTGVQLAVPKSESYPPEGETKIGNLTKIDKLLGNGISVSILTRFI